MRSQRPGCPQRPSGRPNARQARGHAARRTLARVSARPEADVALLNRTESAKLSDMDEPTLVSRAIKILTERSAVGLCPRCGGGGPGNTGWVAEVQGISVQAYPPSIPVISLPTPMFPAVVLTCKNCGFMSMHNLKMLGLVT